MSEIKLSFSKNAWEYDPGHHCRQLLNIPYCSHPTAPKLQCLNIYVPESYLDEDGNIQKSGKCGKYTAATAPIVVENGIQGYGECSPKTLLDPPARGIELLQHGIIFVTMGARGRQTNVDGKFIGRSPAALIDAKSAIRFLRYNRDSIPGDTERIINLGVSAGGSISTLLGVTGNLPLYESYLTEAGAAPERDDVFATQCYCPISDLDHANGAYEWMFRGLKFAAGMPPMFPRYDLSDFQQALSEQLALQYVSYFNSLQLKDPETGEVLQRDTDGQGGSGYTYLKHRLELAAGKYLRLLEKGVLPLHVTPQQYIYGDYVTMGRRPKNPGGPGPVEFEAVERHGIDRSAWLSYDGKNAKITSIADMFSECFPRLKNCPAFDDLEYAQFESQEFGNEDTEFTHFDSNVAQAMCSLQDAFPQECGRYLAAYQAVENDSDMLRRKYLLNPLNFIGTEAQGKTCEHWRFRVGTRDNHTSYLISQELYLKLLSTGLTDVSHEYVWDYNHGSADYSGEFVAWVEALCK